MKIRTSLSSCILLLLVLVIVIDELSAIGQGASSANFVSIRVLPDGEQERRIHRDRVTARETTDSTGLRLLQVVWLTESTDESGQSLRRHLLQAVYDPKGDLTECEYVRDDRTAVQEFLEELEDDFAAADSLQSAGAVECDDGDNVTVRLLQRGDLAKWTPFKRLVDYKSLRDQCQMLHIKMKKSAQLAADGHRRKKRELFIYPGTKWCGAGTTSTGFAELGWYAAADRCCRQHDHCGKTIQGFATKYNLFNYRFHTISDCECDERFRTCLKMLNNEHSNLVGKIFFNVMQMKCFKIKHEKVCEKTSWWGRCLKHGRKQTAQLKDPLPY